MMAPLRFLMLRHWREMYPSRWALFGELAGLLVSLLLYWYTAQAFTPAFDSAMTRYGCDYFTYVLIGETMLFMPLFFLEGISRTIRHAVSDGVLESYLTLPLNPQVPIVLSGIAMLPRELLRLGLTLALAGLLFQLAIPVQRLPLAIAIQLLAVPLFLGIGLLAAAVILRFGRGAGILSHLGGALALLAGAYFPVAVLPESLQAVAQTASPFTMLLDTIRLSLVSGPVDARPIALGALRLGAAGLIFLPLGYWALGLSIQHVRRSGSARVAVN